MNYELGMRNGKKSAGIFLLTFFLLTCIAVPLRAHAASLSDLIPCTNTLRTNPDGSSFVEDQCSACEAFTVSQKVLNFIYWNISVPLATVMFLWAGFLMVASGVAGSPTWYDTGKKIIKRALVGVFIIFFAWMAIDTVIKLAAGQISVSGPAQLPKGAETVNPLPEFENPTVEARFGPWNEVSCTPPEPAFFPASPRITAQEGEGQSVHGSLSNERAWGACSPGLLARLPAEYNRYFDEAVSFFPNVNKARIQALCVVESGCSNGAPPSNDNDGGHSYGLMQIRPDTACLIDHSIQGCAFIGGRWKAAQPDSVIAALRDPRMNIRLGVAYYSRLLAVSGRTDYAAAGYNGGDVAFQPSVDCPGTVKYLCLWDNQGHTLPNERPGHPGFGVTRRYVPKVENTEQQIRDGQC